MIHDINLRRFLDGYLGMSEEDMGKISEEQHEVLKAVGFKAGKYKVVAEVVSAKYCSAGLKPGQKYVIDPAQMINMDESTAPLCLGALTPLAQRMEVYLDRMGNSDEIVSSLRGFRCADPGVGLNGLGTVEFKVYIEDGYIKNDLGDSLGLKDKVVIIVGVGQGIGRTLADKFAAVGAKVVIAQRSVDSGEQIVKEITDQGFEACFIKTDISLESSTNTLMEKTIDKYGRIDILINNATVTLESLDIKPFEEITIEEWEKVMAVNLTGTWLTCKSAVLYMKKQKWGKIITTSSSAWDKGELPLLHYLTSKAGIVGMTRGMARELGRWNITVNCVSYGPVITESNKDVYLKDEQDFVLGTQSILRPATPDELAGTVMFLASEQSDFMTGQTIYPNGGSYFH
ncbi:MAG: SDR family oxidoreductase [Deltaproteobacteria bacterium]|nr:SDR family oxidoreductase [Deltaproteobacteria bacterium]